MNHAANPSNLSRDVTMSACRRTLDMAAVTAVTAVTALTELATLALLPGLALGHGDDGHAGKLASAKPEQQPWGIADDATKASRSIAVSIGVDMRFTPDRIALRRGDTVRFTTRNRSRQLHECVFGAPQALDEHAALMLKFPT
jgi:plastocyanin